MATDIVAVLYDLLCGLYSGEQKRSADVAELYTADEPALSGTKGSFEARSGLALPP